MKWWDDCRFDFNRPRPWCLQHCAYCTPFPGQVGPALACISALEAHQSVALVVYCSHVTKSTATALTCTTSSFWPGNFSACSTVVRPFSVSIPKGGYSKCHIQITMVVSSAERSVRAVYEWLWLRFSASHGRVYMNITHTFINYPRLSSQNCLVWSHSFKTSKSSKCLI